MADKPKTERKVAVVNADRLLAERYADTVIALVNLTFKIEAEIADPPKPGATPEPPLTLETVAAKLRAIIENGT